MSILTKIKNRGKVRTFAVSKHISIVVASLKDASYDVEEVDGVHVVTIDQTQTEELSSFIDGLLPAIVKETTNSFKIERTYYSQDTQRAKWMNARRNFLTSSSGWLTNKGTQTQTEDKKIDIIAVDAYIDSLDPQNPLRLEHEAMNKLNPIEKMQRGNDLEKTALEEYDKKTGYNVDMDIDFRYIKDTLIGTSIDALAFPKGKRERVVEAKCPSLYNYMNDNYSDKYTQQIQQHLFVFGLDECDFVVYFPHLPIKIKTIKRDSSFMYNMIESMKRVQEKRDKTYFNLMELHLSN